MLAVALDLSQLLRISDDRVNVGNYNDHDFLQKFKFVFSGAAISAVESSQLFNKQ
jgi:hypothetical protein